MDSVNFKTSLALGRERFISPFTLMAFVMTQEDSDEQFNLIYSDLNRTGSLPFKKTTNLEAPKTVKASCNLRLQGNKEFPRDLRRALLFYNKSVATAPYPASDSDTSTELALAFANRSAVYAKMKRNEAALRDIERALSFQYPDNLKYKLYERRTDCYRNLGRWGEAVESCQESIAHLSLATEPPADKLALLTSMLESLSFGSNKQQRRGQSGMGVEKMPIPRKTYGDHAQIPAASNCLEIQYSDEFGYHVVSTRDINPGDILATEDPFVSVLFPKHYYTYCYHCMKRSDAMIPCKHCSLAMFCTDACRSLAWEGYHRTECRILPLINEHDIGHVPPVSLRMLLVAISRYADHSLEKLWHLVRELEESRKNVKPRHGFGQVGQPYGISRDYAAIHFLDRERAFRVDVGDKKNLDVFLVSAINASIIVNCLECYTNLFRPPKAPTGIPAKRRPSSSELKVFVGRLIMRYHQIIPANARTVIDFEFDTKGMSFYGTDCGVAVHNVLSFFSHSCCHNASIFSYNGDSAFLAANQPIKKGEQLFVSYGSNFADRSLADRASYLLEMNTICCCEACLNDWPTTEEMITKSPPKMICCKCSTPIANAYNGVARCTQCGTRKKVIYTTNQQLAMSEKLKTIGTKIYKRSYLQKDFVPDLAASLTFVFNNYQIPNLMMVFAQQCLFENFRRYNNYSGIWAPESSEM